MDLYRRSTEVEAEALMKWFVLNQPANLVPRVGSGLSRPQISLLLLGGVDPFLLPLLVEIGNALAACSLWERHGRAEL